MKAETQKVFVITKNMITIMTFLVLLLSAISSVIAYNVGSSYKIEELGNQITDLKTTTNNIEENTIKNSNRLTRTETQYENIQGDLLEIKKILYGLEKNDLYN